VTENRPEPRNDLLDDVADSLISGRVGRLEFVGLVGRDRLLQFEDLGRRVGGVLTELHRLARRPGVSSPDEQRCFIDAGCGPGTVAAFLATLLFGHTPVMMGIKAARLSSEQDLYTRSLILTDHRGWRQESVLRLSEIPDKPLHWSLFRGQADASPLLLAPLPAVRWQRVEDSPPGAPVLGLAVRWDDEQPANTLLTILPGMASGMDQLLFTAAVARRRPQPWNAPGMHVRVSHLASLANTVGAFP
jgi:hypothetical protein